MLLELSVAGIATILLLEVWRAHRELTGALASRGSPTALSRYPSVSVIRPIRGLDSGAEENARAALQTGYPGEVETLFVFDDDRDPGLPPVRRAVHRHQSLARPGRARILFAGDPPAHRTGKLNAMIFALRHARGEIVVFADSDTRADAGALTTLIETLHSDPRAGAAFAPVVVKSTGKTAGDVGYALLLNGLYGAAAALSTIKHGGELPFIMGQFMAFKRHAIEAIGGLETAEGQLVDDMYLGARVKAEGMRNLVSPHPVPIVMEELSLRAFFAVYYRWIVFSRTGLPDFEFKLISFRRGLTFWLGALLALGAAVAGMWLPALLAALAPAATAASINRLHSSFGGAPVPARFAWVAAGLLAWAPPILLAVHTRRTVSWRGRTYNLNAASALARSGPEREHEAWQVRSVA